MRTRLLRALGVFVLAAGLRGIWPSPSFAATTVSDCPTTESALSTDITNAGSGGTVAFTCTSATTIPFSSTISISQPVTLDASGAGGAVTFDGGSTAQLFDVFGGEALSVVGLTLAHGSAGVQISGPLDGGAIYNGGTLTITSCTFTGNSASRGGGALYNTGTLHIISSIFSGNSAGYSGGAIADAGTVTISSSTFSGDSAPYGGAIFNGGTLTVTSSTLTENSASGAAGAIDNHTTGTLTVTNSTLSGNSSPVGGAILTYGVTTITGSTLSNNSASQQGGVIYNGYTLDITSSTLSDNSASWGAAIYNSNYSTVTIADSTLSGDTASDSGGAVENNGTMTVTGSAFFGDSASNYGGAIDNGGALHAGALNSGSMLTISTSTLTDNSSSYQGGAVFNAGSDTVANSTFSGNSSLFGGAVSSASTLNVGASTFSGNAASIQGGAIAMVSGTASVSSSTFSGNSAPVQGGAIDSDAGGTTITTSTFSGNSAPHGGAIDGYSGTVSVGGSIVAGSSAGNCAGSITDSGYNLSDDKSCGFATANHDLLDTNPHLGPLQNNGGPTETMALLPSSPAIDQIPSSDATLCPTAGTDQRGSARPDDGESACDLGAYESSYISATTTGLSSSVNPSASGQPVTFTATVSVAAPGAGTPTGTIQFSIDGATFGSPVALSDGTATSQAISSLTPGDHTVKATYSGDANFTGSSTSLTQTVSTSRLSGSLSAGFRPVEGQIFSGMVAGFTDSNTSISAAQLSASIAWGDGITTTGTVSGSAGSFIVSGSHTYADEGSQAVMVTLQEQTPGNASGTASGTTAVAERDALSPVTFSPAAATAGAPFSGAVAAFTDTDTASTAGDFTAGIRWGDGTTTTGTISGSHGHFTVSGSHTYALPGPYTVQTTLTDDAPGTAHATAAATISVSLPASSVGSTTVAFGTSTCTTLTATTTVAATGAASGSFYLRDERPGGTPCAATAAGAVTLQNAVIQAVECTSPTTATIFGKGQLIIVPSTAGQPVSFQADLAITSSGSSTNGTMSVQASDGYIGVFPEAVRITGCAAP